MELPDLLDQSFLLYRENIGCFFGVVLVINAVVFGLERFLDVDGANRDLASHLTIGPSGLPSVDFGPGAGGPAAVIWFFFLARFILTQLSMAALTHAVSRRFLDEPASVLDSYRAVLRRFHVLIVTGMLAGVLYSFGCAMFCLPGMMLMAAFVFAPLVVVLETAGPVSALRRSFVLTVRRSTGRLFHHNFFKISMILTMFTLVSLAAYGLASTPRLVLYGWYHWSGLRPEMMVEGAAERLLRTVEYLGISAVEPLGMTALVLLYYDIRMRTEGFDLERLLASLKRSGPATSP